MFVCCCPAQGTVTLTWCSPQGWVLWRGCSTHHHHRWHYYHHCSHYSRCRCCWWRHRQFPSHECCCCCCCCAPGWWWQRWGSARPHSTPATIRCHSSCQPASWLTGSLETQLALHPPLTLVKKKTIEFLSCMALVKRKPESFVIYGPGEREKQSICHLWPWWKWKTREHLLPMALVKKKNRELLSSIAQVKMKIREHLLSMALVKIKNRIRTWWKWKTDRICYLWPWWKWKTDNMCHLWLWRNWERELLSSMALVKMRNTELLSSMAQVKKKNRAFVIYGPGERQRAFVIYGPGEKEKQSFCHLWAWWKRNTDSFRRLWPQ